MMKVKNFRRRAEDDDDGDDDVKAKADAEVKPHSNKGAAAKKKDYKSKDKLLGSKPPAAAAAAAAAAAGGRGGGGGGKLLSFAEDEEGAVEGKVELRSKKERKPANHPGLLSFAIDQLHDDALPKSKKKAAAVAAAAAAGLGSLTQQTSHKLSSAKDKSLSIPSNFQPQAGEYTKEKLLELQKNTRSLGPSKAPVDTKPPEPVIVLKGLVKPIDEEDKEVPENVDAKVTEEAPSADLDRLRRDRNDAESRLGLMGIGAGAESGGVTHIPDAAAIAAAKAKRERLRQAQAAPDYIPLGSGEAVDIRSKLREHGLQGEGALSSDDEGEIEGRIAMLGDKKAENNRIGVFESVDDRFLDTGPLGQGNEEEEDEERRWEEEQLRKGFGKRIEDSTSRATQVSSIHHEAVHSTGYVPSAPAPTMGWGFGGRSMESLSASQQAEAAMRTLQENIQRMRETHGRTKLDLQKTEENLSASLHNITSLENLVAAAGEKYLYMQKLRDYIAVLCDFLKNKGPLIEELEEHMQRLHEERATAMMERRLLDNADEISEVEAAIVAATSLLNRGVGTAAAAAAAAAVVIAREGAQAPPQLDEFGRDLNLQKRLEAKRRAESRERRIARASMKRAAAITASNADVSQKIEGESSSDESDSEMKAFRSSQSDVLETAEQIFRDATEDFADLMLVKKRLEEWKKQYSAAYKDAYMPLSVPAIFAPYVRLELLKWDPLHEDADFNNMKWHSILFDYGMPENGDDLNPDDADIDLVPKLVEKVALPILHHEIAHCWDRLSTKGTRNAVGAVQVILNYVPVSCEALQDLLAAVRMRLAEAVTAMELPVWNAAVMSAVTQTSRIAAYRFGTSVRLLRNIALWKDVLAMPVLEQLAIDELLCGKMIPHLQSLISSPVDAVTRTERIVAAVSGVWAGPKLSGQSSHKLEPLIDYLMTLGRVVEKRRDAGVCSDDVSALARRLKRMLVELNDYDKARRISKLFQLREAL